MQSTAEISREVFALVDFFESQTMDPNSIHCTHEYELISFTVINNNANLTLATTNCISIRLSTLDCYSPLL